MEAVISLDSTSVLTTPDGRWAISRSQANECTVWDVERCQQIRAFTGGASWGRALGRAPDGRWLTAASQSHVVRIRDLESGAVLRTLPGEIRSDYIMFSGDAGMLVAGSEDYGDDPLLVWSVETGRALLAPDVGDYNTGAVSAVAISLDARWVAAGFHFGYLSLWDMHNRTLVRTWQGHRGPKPNAGCGVNSIVFSADGQLIASSSYDRTIRLWLRETGSELKTLDAGSGVFRSVSFGSRDRWLVASDDQKNLYVWDSENADPVATFAGDSPMIVSGCSPQAGIVVINSERRCAQFFECRDC